MGTDGSLESHVQRHLLCLNTAIPDFRAKLESPFACVCDHMLLQGDSVS